MGIIVKGLSLPKGGTITFKTIQSGPAAIQWVTPAGSIGSYINDANIDYQFEVTSTYTLASWAITSGALPDGLLLNGFTGELSGSASAVSSTVYSFRITVTDINNNTASRNFSITIGPVQTNVLWVTPSGSLGGSDIGGVFVTQLEATSS